jgi:hypothetical protein
MAAFPELTRHRIQPGSGWVRKRSGRRAYASGCWPGPALPDGIGYPRGFNFDGQARISWGSWVGDHPGLACPWRPLALRPARKPVACALAGLPNVGLSTQTVAFQLKVSGRQLGLPALPRSDCGGVVEEGAFLFLLGQLGEFGMEGVLRCEHGFLAVEDRRVGAGLKFEAIDLAGAERELDAAE